MSTGSDNPNYKDGRYCNPHFCACGKEMDRRARRCLDCKLVKLDSRLDEVRAAHQSATSLHGMAKALGVSRQSVTRFIDREGWDCSHFISARDRPQSLDEVFTLTKTTRYATVRKYILAYDLIPYVCSTVGCGLSDEWLGNPILLELDHIDGNPLNNNLDNLRFLCPNCHSQTATFRGRNSRGTPKTIKRPLTFLDQSSNMSS